MNITILVSRALQNDALDKARKVGTSTLSAGVLHAPLGSEAQNVISKIWDEIEGALRCAYSEGMAVAKPIIDVISKKISDVGLTMAKQAESIKQVLTERLNVYVQATIEGALARVRPSLSVGGKELPMKSVTVEQKIRLSGSLKASLESICEFVAEGEISLSAEYGVG